MHTMLTQELRTQAAVVVVVKLLVATLIGAVDTAILLKEAAQVS